MLNAFYLKFQIYVKNDMIGKEYNKGAFLKHI